MSRSENGAGSGDYRNTPERGAAFSPLTLRSHALAATYSMHKIMNDKMRAHCIGTTDLYILC